MFLICINGVARLTFDDSVAERPGSLIYIFKLEIGLIFCFLFVKDSIRKLYTPIWQHTHYNSPKLYERNKPFSVLLTLSMALIVYFLTHLQFQHLLQIRAVFWSRNRTILQTTTHFTVCARRKTIRISDQLTADANGED